MEQTAINGIVKALIHGHYAHQQIILHVKKKEVIIVQMMAEHGNGEHALMDVLEEHALKNQMDNPVLLIQNVHQETAEITVGLVCHVQMNAPLADVLVMELIHATD